MKAEVGKNFRSGVIAPSDAYGVHFRRTLPAPDLFSLARATEGRETGRPINDFRRFGVFGGAK